MLEEDALVVLDVTLSSGACQVNVEYADELVGQLKSLSHAIPVVRTRGRVQATGRAAVDRKMSTVAFDGMVVELEALPNGVRVTVYSNNLEVRGVPVKAMTRDRKLVYETKTDRSGRANLELSGSENYLIAVERK